MREISVTEQRYKAVLAVIADGRTVTQVARDWNVARQTVHVWLERYEADGLDGWHFSAWALFRHVGIPHFFGRRDLRYRVFSSSLRGLPPVGPGSASGRPAGRKS